MYISVKDAAAKFKLSTRRVQLLCEQGRIPGAERVSGVWLIPETAPKPVDGRRKRVDDGSLSVLEGSQNALSIDDASKALSVSKGTIKNWIRLGKIAPDLGEQLFSSGYIERIDAELKSEDNTRLKSRRNKKNAVGKFLYKNYVRTERNQNTVLELLELGVVENEKDLSIVLANFAVQLYYQSRDISFVDNNVLLNFLSQGAESEFYFLVKDLLGDSVPAPGSIEKLQPALSKRVVFVEGEDTLGFVYLSLRDISRRKSAGAYYTPEYVVEELIRLLLANDLDVLKKTVCDPCCGTGNILLRLGLTRGDCVDLYGQDIDPISVFLARINIALIDPEISASDIRARIVVGNAYFETFPQKFDSIVGNPPWGGEFSEESARRCRKLFKTAAGKNLESYDLFIEKGLSMLRRGGILAFILPEAILSVAAHDAVRRLLIDSCSFKFMSYLGNVFSEVQCPSIILGVTPDDEKTAVGCVVSKGRKEFVISRPRIFHDGILSLDVTDEEDRCLESIANIENAVYLKGNAQFALGIVTGNNKKYLSTEKRDGYEVVLRGGDIQRYGTTPSGNYIRFTPESFQQTAPIEIYRAKEKLLYRFISEVPVFAYDDRQTLSLNSCNIVIPKIEGLDMKYVLAILNSRAAAFFVSKRFNSVKLLRSHIERIPIPVVSTDVQKSIIKRVELIMKTSRDIEWLYDNVDEDIMALYRLTHEQIKTIHAALKLKNLFFKNR